MPKLLIDENGFRIVHDIVSGQDVFTLERRNGCDAMGEPRWEHVKTESTRMVELLYKYILKITLQEVE